MVRINDELIRYIHHDVELTKEAAKHVHKIIRTSTNDPRMNYNTGNVYVVIDGKAYIPETMEVRTGFREQMEFGFTVSTDPRYAATNTMLSIKDVIFNPPATIVFWGDGSKTVVKCQDGEEFDPEKGLTMAFFKRMHDNKGHYFEEIKKWAWMYSPSSEGVEVTFTFKDWCQARRVTEEILRLKTEDEAGKDAKTNKVWVVFYALDGRGEDEGYTRYPVMYKHKSSAVRAAKRLISKLPDNVEYEWFVDFVDITTLDKPVN